MVLLLDLSMLLIYLLPLNWKPSFLLCAETLQIRLPRLPCPLISYCAVTKERKWRWKVRGDSIPSSFPVLVSIAHQECRWSSPQLFSEPSTPASAISLRATSKSQGHSLWEVQFAAYYKIWVKMQGRFPNKYQCYSATLWIQEYITLTQISVKC